MDKYIQYMSNEEIDTLLLNNSVSVRPITMEAFVHQNIWLITGLVAAVSGSIILLLCINLFNISRSKRRIQDLLYRDELTGLDNINRFYVRAEELLATGKYAVVYCDIDRFKLINDTFGFEEGDEVLRAFGSILQKSMEDRECCARLSADNFVMLRHYKQWETLAADLMHIQAVLNKWRGERGIIPYEIAVSFGVYQADAGETNDMKQMLDFANYAMRSAKTAAGEAASYMMSRCGIRPCLNRGWREGWPPRWNRGNLRRITSKGGHGYRQDCGLRSLVRWNHPEQGLLMRGPSFHFLKRRVLLSEWTFICLSRYAAQYADGWMRDVPLLQSHVISRRCISDMTGLPARFLKLLIGSRFPIICWKWRLPKVRLPMHLRVCPPP